MKFWMLKSCLLLCQYIGWAFSSSKTCARTVN